MSTTYQRNPTRMHTVDMKLRMGSVLAFSNDQLMAIRQLNPSMRIDRDALGDLEISNPPSEETHWRCNRLYLTLAKWSMDDRSGLVFNVGTAFALPNDAMRSIDLAWTAKARLQKLGIRKKLPKYLPLCPDFAIRFCEPHIPLEAALVYMRELMANGTRMSWLIDPENQQVHIFNQGEPEFCLDNPSSISGEPVLHGFSLHPDVIWMPH